MRDRSQWALVALGLLAWSVWRAPTLAAAALSYVGAVLVFGRFTLDLKRRHSGIALLLLAALACLTMGRATLETDQLAGLPTVLADRLRLEADPALAPPVVLADRPQSFYVRSGGARVSLSFGGAQVGAEALGHGLFRADYDPRIHGAPNEVAVIDVDGSLHSRPVARIAPWPHPRRFATLGDEAAAVSEETDELFVVTRTTIARFETGDGPTDCAFLDDGRVLVTHREGVVAIVDREGSRVERDLGGPLVRAAVRGSTIAVARAGERPAILFLEGDLSIAAEIAIPFRPDAFVLHGDAVVIASRGTRALHRYHRTKPGLFAEERRRFLGRPAIDLALDDHLFALVTDFRPDGDAGPNHHIEEQILEIDPATLAIVRRTPAPGSPYAITLRDGRAVVAFAGADHVRPFDGQQLGPPIPADRPVGVADLGDGWIAIASAAAGRITVVGPGGERAVHALGSPDPVRSEGERAFFQSTRKGPACQTCHPDGDSDHSMHDIGHGEPRPTLSALGVARTAPYLRGASYPSLAALEAFTTYVLGGYDQPIEDRAAKLEAYVSSLGRRPRWKGSDPVVVRRGAEAFVRAGCESCHRFPAFTDLAQVPEGFLFPKRGDEIRLLDTPSLIGVAETGPYLTDGRAESLEAVLFEHNEAQRHGDTESLPEDDRTALLAFLRSL